MNKKDLVEVVAQAIGDEKTATHAVTAVLTAIQGAVARGEKVSLTGFGTFEAVHKAARVGRNPSTGATIEVAESWGPKFRPGSDFKAAVATSRQGTSSMTPPCPL